METDKVQAHWAATQKLTYVVLALWVFFGFIIHMFAGSLNNVVILGFPMGFYMAAQGSLIVFVALLFWFSSAQDKVDRRYGMAEED